ncbi:MAG: bypass of forespore [Bacilli bacterium]|nr:bypass of forespore [Bacilli bacterium]
MSFSNLIKQLKKRLKSGKRRLSLGILLVCLGLAALGLWIQASNHSLEASERNAVNAKAVFAPETNQQTEDVLQQIKKSGVRETFLQKIYVCGEETAKIGTLKSADIVAYHLAHLQDQMKLNEQGQVYFTEQVEDLSVQCKQNAFFGLDKNGNLSLFEGLPMHEQIIRTFFQLNVEHLKTSLPQGTLNQLEQGIKVSDLAEYNSVLSTFSDYAVEAVGR